MSWYPTNATLTAIDAGGQKLIDNFQEYLRLFNEANAEGRSFGGPSLYFHTQAIRGFRGHSIEEKLNDTRFFELIYAALTSWGMHRMGKTKTKLCEFDNFRAQIVEQKQELQALEKRRIWEFKIGQGEAVGRRIAGILQSWQISLSSAQLVAGSKTLHHILPDLVPPIDRNYTLRFFGINTMLPSQKSAGDIFPYLYRPFGHMAYELKDQVLPLINNDGVDWHTCFTKVLDNALLGSFY